MSLIVQGRDHLARRRWWDILKCSEAWRESLDSLTLDQDEYPWRAVVNTVMNIRVPSKGWQCEQRRGCYSGKVMRSYVTHWQ